MSTDPTVMPIAAFSGTEDLDAPLAEATPAKAGERVNLKSFTLPQLTEWLAGLGEKPFRARQIFQWLYQRRVTDFEEMTDLSKPLRAKLAGHAHLGVLETESVHHSADGSRKFALRLSDGKHIETVLMPNNTHYTVCVSTQVGCAMGCEFCMTAKMGLVRNLTSAEIVEQLCVAGRALEDDRILRNVVFMGMGEPFHNYNNLVDALRIFHDDFGFGLSWQRMTVSTSGLVPAIERFGREGIRANLAVSLNGARDEVRTRLMPINKRWNIERLLQACRKLPLEHRTRITFEYVLIAGETDDLADARLLVKLLHGLKCKVNLIPYNAGPENPFQSPGLDHCRTFQEVLLDRGVLATLRISKGQDIQAACGQLIQEGRFPLPAQSGVAVAPL